MFQGIHTHIIKQLLVTPPMQTTPPSHIFTNTGFFFPQSRRHLGLSCASGAVLGLYMLGCLESVLGPSWACPSVSWPPESWPRARLLGPLGTFLELSWVGGLLDSLWGFSRPLGVSWGSLGDSLGFLGAFLKLLGHFWDHGPSWDYFGPSWGHHGPSLALSWNHFGTSWNIFGTSWEQLGPLWAIVGHLGPI